MASAKGSQIPAVDFELKTDPIWQIPDRGLKTELTITLEITNRGPHPLRFPLLDSFHIWIEGPEGRVREMVGGTDGIRPGKPISKPVSPGEKLQLMLFGELRACEHARARLRIQDDFGGIWWMEPLNAGTNLLHMRYESLRGPESNNDIWTGRAVIEPVRVDIVAQ